MYSPYTKVLCQDCLRVKDFTDARHGGDEYCECGGDLCGCESCTDTINQLVAGHRGAEKTGILEDVAKWSEENGIDEGHE